MSDGGVSGVPADLLTGPPDKEVGKLQAAVKEADVKREFATKESRVELRRHIMTLRESEVWAVFTAYFKHERAQLNAFVIDGSSPNELLKYSGELKMLQKVTQWPVMMLNAIDHMDKLEVRKKEMEDARANQAGPARSQRPLDRG